ncbi:YceI-like domain-containing protein [Filimonas lacunae]|uniref:YceI-like domain-containing protein n=1 Tax=Filimonas lacunae TaxID=477680 RepID=A0A173MGQ1_9BACT|nr:YceI family protein [Filimonas lacunae]BAV06676.1 hypothetical protein FLA_2695 [Filimonas lacunae]SIT27869.1 YceI-like domain-containing protein [Filimonas lacunae]
MKTHVLALLLGLLCTGQGYSQLYATKNGSISFFSTTPLEDIKAYNNQVYAVIDAGKKELAFALLMKGFLFTRQLQQDHFNENYVESDKYPKASFSGTYTGEVLLAKDGVYPVSVSGNLTIHGVTQPVKTTATLEVKQGHILGHCSFIVKPEDYRIIIPSLVRDKIAKQVTVSVQVDASTH